MELKDHHEPVLSNIMEFTDNREPASSYIMELKDQHEPALSNIMEFTDQHEPALSDEECFPHSRKRKYDDKLQHQQQKVPMLKCVRSSIYGIFDRIDHIITNHLNFCSMLSVVVSLLLLLLVGSLCYKYSSNQNNASHIDTYNKDVSNKKFLIPCDQKQVLFPSNGLALMKTGEVGSQESIHHFLKVIQLVRMSPSYSNRNEDSAVYASDKSTLQSNSVHTKANIITRNLRDQLAHNNRLPWHPVQNSSIDTLQTISYREQSRTFVIPENGSYFISVSIGFHIEGNITKNLTGKVFRHHDGLDSLLMKKTVSVNGNVDKHCITFISVKLYDIFYLDQGIELHVDVENSTISNILLYVVCNSIEVYEVTNMKQTK